VGAAPCGGRGGIWTHG